MQDVAYFLMTSVSGMHVMDERMHVEFYYAQLLDFLRTQGVDDVPDFSAFWDSYMLAVCDLARWMAGWSWWGQAPPRLVAELIHVCFKLVAPFGLLDPIQATQSFSSSLSALHPGRHGCDG